MACKTCTRCNQSDDDDWHFKTESWVKSRRLHWQFEINKHNRITRRDVRTWCEGKYEFYFSVRKSRSNFSEASSSLHRLWLARVFLVHIHCESRSQSIPTFLNKLPPSTIITIAPRFQVKPWGCVASIVLQVKATPREQEYRYWMHHWFPYHNICFLCQTAL